MINNEKELNKLVFEVYKNVLKMDYNKNSKKSPIDKINKLFRYIKSGYIFSLKSNRKLMSKMNEFIESECVYDNLKIAIYTVSTGQYDKILDPIYVDDKLDYFVFTEATIPNDSVWKKMQIPNSISKMSSLEKARYIKTHPYIFFKDYDISVFIDGNIRITCDIKPLIYSMLAAEKVIAIHRHQTRDCIYDEGKAIYAAGKAKIKDINDQLKVYRNEGFPEHYGLFETNVVIRKHNDPECIQIMEAWWEQMAKYTKRDQLSFTYALWKNKKQAEYVLSLGNNSRRNPYFIVDAHN